MEDERLLVRTYRVSGGLSIMLMLAGWLWHLYWRDATNPVITAGLLLLLLTPVIGLVHISILALRSERRFFAVSLSVIALIGLAYVVGKI